MTTALDQVEKQALQQKRQDLFSLWNRSRQASVHTLPVDTKRATPEKEKAQSDEFDEIRRLIQFFADPNSDRLFL